MAGVGIYRAFTAKVDLLPLRGVRSDYAQDEAKEEHKFFIGLCGGVPLALAGFGLLATSFPLRQPTPAWKRLSPNHLLPRVALWRWRKAMRRPAVPVAEMKPLRTLGVRLDGECIGQITVTMRLPDRFFGYFAPGDVFERSRPAFEEVWKWSRQFEDAVSAGSVHDVAWEHYLASIRRLTAGITLPEFPEPIDLFVIDHYRTVEVRFTPASNLV